MYQGDFAVDDTVIVPFHTFDSNDPSASVTISGLATTDIEIYKNGSATQRASDNGYTLLDTDGIDFDGITGIHGFSIDTSDNSDAGFFSAGGEYMVVVSSITVDAATVNFVAATFSIERTNGAIAQLKAMLDGNNRVDVGSWLGNAVTASSGNPDVNVESIDDIDAPATWQASMNAQMDTALSDYDGPTNAEMVARTLAAGPLAQLTQNLDNCFTGTASGTPTTTTMVSDITVTVDDQFNGRIITFDDDTTTTALRGQSTDITACTASSNTLTFTATTTAPVSGDTFTIT